jgi:hypothetical protein
MESTHGFKQHGKGINRSTFLKSMRGIAKVNQLNRELKRNYHRDALRFRGRKDMHFFHSSTHMKTALRNVEEERLYRTG